MSDDKETELKNQSESEQEPEMEGTAPTAPLSAAQSPQDGPAASPQSASDNQSRSDNQSNNESPNPSKKSWLGALVLAVIVAALGASGYAHWWQYQQSLQQQLTLQQHTDDLQQQVNQQAEQLQQSRDTRQQLQRQLSDELQATKDALQEQRQAQAILTQQLEAQNQRLLQLSTTNSENWELAEALYLTRLANQRLAMEQNREAALALLEGADEILGRQQNPELFPVREQLNQDITALRVVEAVDREGLFLQLSALLEQLQHLPLTRTLDFETRRQPQDEQPTSAQPQNLWQRFTASFKNTFGQLNQYVRKVDLEQSPKPLLAPDEQQSIRLAVTLYLESAQIALLRAQPLAFKNALQQAQQQLSTYYPETSQRQELMLALQSLSDESVQPALPDISRSYLRLNEYIQNRATAGSQSASGDSQQ